MRFYVVLERYDGKGENITKFAPFSITKARADAYRMVDHNSKYNKEGLYKVGIYIDRISGDPSTSMKIGEVMNTAYDDRYWYPDPKFWHSKYRKYPLYKNGTLGKGMW